MVTRTDDWAAPMHWLHLPELQVLCCGCVFRERERETGRLLENWLITKTVSLPLNSTCPERGGVLFRLEMFDVNLAHSFAKHHDVNSTDLGSSLLYLSRFHPYVQYMMPSAIG